MLHRLCLAIFLLIVAAVQSTTSTDHVLDDALAYVTQLIGTKYGWWRGGQIPATGPAWALDAPPTSDRHRQGELGVLCGHSQSHASGGEPIDTV